PSLPSVARPLTRYMTIIMFAYKCRSSSINFKPRSLRMRDRFPPTALVRRLAYRIAGDASGIPLPPAPSIRARLKNWAAKFAAEMAAHLQVPRILLAATILGGFGVASTAGAEVISPDVGLSATLDAVAISIYYHRTLTGYRVVITAGTTDL